MSVKLLWLPGRVSYRLRVFAGQNSQRRGFAGELTLNHDEARELRSIIAAGEHALGDVEVTEAGWRDPVELTSGRR